MKKIVRNIICNTVLFSCLACALLIRPWGFRPGLDCEWDPHQEKGDRLRFLYDGEVVTVGELLSRAFIVFLLVLIAVMIEAAWKSTKNESKSED
jgi:hypothetical protein